jgi:hypothetical protein
VRGAIMALPIKETPVLKGKDAERFIRIAEGNTTKTISRQEMLDTKKAFNILMPKLRKYESN